MKHLKISCQKHYCHPGAWLTTCTWKVFHFYMLISMNKWKWLRICLKKAYGEKLIYWKDMCCRYTLKLPHRGNSNMYLQHMLLKIRKKNIWHIHFLSIMSIVFTSLKHPKLPISIKIPVRLLQFVYICMTAISPNLSSWTTSLLAC